MVAEKFGIDTSEYSFPYIASWSEGKQLEQLKNALQEIQSAAKQISNAIESELLKMQKRHLSIDEKIADTELNNVQKAEFLIEDCSDRGVEFSEEDTKTILEFAEQHNDISETVQLVEDMEITQRQRDNYGYDFTFMKPLDSKEAALEAFDKGEAVYLLYPDNTEGMALERSEIENFEGYFGIEKEPKNEIKRDENLIGVSKSVALEMWEKNSDVFIDGVPADSREDIANAPDTAKFAVLEYQFSAELDFDKIGGNTMARNYNNGYGQQNYNQSAPTNPNVIGNTPYNQLGGKGQLEFYTNLKNRHADNIAAQLNADRVRFSGLRKGEVTTITINKADIPRYEAVVEKVKQSYRQHDNFYTAYEGRDPEGFVKRLNDKFGIDRAMYDENLSAIFDGKFLYSSERDELRDDFRGIPETKYYKSSANEFFIPEIGWLDDAAYNRELKSSELTSKDFYAKVTRINAACIDDRGIVERMDMSRAEYEAMTEKTYAPENAEALKATLDKLEERKARAGLSEKPTEYYAVRQESSRKFSVCSISADGLVTKVKPNITSITEAKKAMFEIFEQKKKSAKVEFVHPQTLDEISAKMYKEREQMPDVLYRITLNPEKNADETHILQEYVKNADGRYSVGQAVVKGDYEMCNKFLSQLINAPKIEPPAQTKDYPQYPAF